jgi:hypothetical protein
MGDLTYEIAFDDARVPAIACSVTLSASVK